MRTTRSFIPSLLALSLAAVLPAAVAAQDEAGAHEVALATGSLAGGPAQVVPATEADLVNGIGTMRGEQVIGIPIEVSDSRLSGRLSFTANGSGQEFANGWGQIEARTYRIENDDGAWTGSGNQVFAIGSGEPLIDHESIVLTGEGAFDGLAAYVFIDSADPEMGVRAVVLDHDVPPAPDRVAADVLAGAPTFDGIAGLDSFLSDTAAGARGGVVALVDRGGETTTSAAGVADADGEPMAVDRAFPVGSISKTFVSTMVLQLVDEGLVDLDATLSKYLPTTNVGADVTVRQLLSHRSGIPEFMAQPSFNEGVDQEPDHVYSSKEVLGIIVDVPSESAGEDFSYSNTNYILLGQLLEAVDGTDLESSLRARIVEPLDLRTTTFDDDSLPSGAIVDQWGFSDAGGAPLPEALSSATWSAGALVSTPTDLAAFMAGLLDGQLISDELLAEMLDTGPEGYGLGIRTMPPGDDSGTLYGHDGIIGNYGAFLASDPETGDTLVVLNNDATLSVRDTAIQILDTWSDSDA